MICAQTHIWPWSKWACFLVLHFDIHPWAVGGVSDSITHLVGYSKQRGELSVVIGTKMDDVTVYAWVKTRKWNQKVTNLVNQRMMERIKMSAGQQQYHVDRSWFISSSQEFCVSLCCAKVLVYMHGAESTQRSYFSVGQEWLSSSVREHHNCVKTSSISEQGLQWP